MSVADDYIWSWWPPLAADATRFDIARAFVSVGPRYGTANLALAYWDADETDTGWTDAGHIQSSSGGWIEVKLPTTIKAASATINVDGDTADWSNIAPASITLQSIRPIAGHEFGEVGPINVDLRVAADSNRIYVLLEVPDDYDFVLEDHHLSPAIGVMIRIDDPAAPHMGTTEEDQGTSLGKVDIWHWELDCVAGETSGGVTGITGGNDPPCNFDDEYSTTPTEREDDGSATAENSLAGVWEHTARAQGNGADGTWIF